MQAHRDVCAVARIGVSSHVSPMNSRLSYLARRPALAIIVPPAIALGTAMVAQHGFGLAPCELCVWQRWPYAAAAALVVPAFLLPRTAVYCLLLAAVAGFVLLVLRPAFLPEGAVQAPLDLAALDLAALEQAG